MSRWPHRVGRISRALGEGHGHDKSPRLCGAWEPFMPLWDATIYKNVGGALGAAISRGDSHPGSPLG